MRLARCAPLVGLRADCDSRHSATLAARSRAGDPSTLTSRLRRFSLIGAAVLVSAAPHVASAQPTSQPRSNAESCIAIPLPVVQGVPGNAEEASSGVRDLLSKYLTGPSMKVVALDSRLDSQVAAEAKEKGCEPVLLATVTRTVGGRKLSNALGQAAGGSAWYLPYGGSIGSTVAHVAASTGLQTVASLAASTKAKDEMRFEYRLQSAAGQVLFGPNTEHQKASVDGEDLLTPLVRRVADAIVTHTPASQAAEPQEDR